MTIRPKWLGIAIMLAAALVAVGAGALAFSGQLSIDLAKSIIIWAVVVAIVPGFVLHLYAVVDQYRQDKR